MKLYFWFLGFLYDVGNLISSIDMPSFQGEGIFNNLLEDSSSILDDSLFESSNYESDSNFDMHDDYMINPATGLLMTGCIDVCGNPYGFDLNSDNDLSCDDSFGTNSGFDEW